MTLLLQIHDELLFECAEQDVDLVTKFVVEEMEQAFQLNVPLKVSVGVGHSWGDM